MAQIQCLMLAAVPAMIAPADEPGILQDIDTPAGYRCWKRDGDSR